MFNKVEICGVNTARLKLLTDDEKRELLIKSSKGDSFAREELINGNLRLVLSVIQRFVSRCDDPDDLFQVGCVGLIKAVDNFDVDQNVKFSTYAVPMIIGEVRRYLRDNNMIRVSRSVRDLAYKAMWAKEEFVNAFGRDPSDKELTDRVNALLQRSDPEAKPVSFVKIAEALDAVVDPVSLYDPVYSEGSDSIFLMDQICDEGNEMDNWCESLALSQASSCLGDREKKIIELRYFAGKTQMEVADEIGISQAQVSRLEKSALKRVRSRL